LAKTTLTRLLVLTLLLTITTGQGAVSASLDPVLLASAIERAEGLKRLHTLIVARDGKVIAERVFRGPGLNRPVNVKSISKSIVSALVGIAIERGVLKGPDQPVAALLPNDLPQRPDPRLARLTIRNLLSMQAGLERTSGRNYGRWVASKNWVRHVLARPFVDEPGGGMLYSTGDWHVLSAILTRQSGRNTHALARDWLGTPLGIRIPPWQKDPQGIFMGGNNMRLSPRALLRFGELYRNRGLHRGKRILPESWIRASWTPRTRSPFSGDEYGYGWFQTPMCDRTVYYARGFGGQFVHVVPSLAMTVVITSEKTTRTRIGGYRESLTSLLRDHLIAAAVKADGGTCPAAY
jgi:CubicO group peptidase (beta-lactamase class C family)